jgi:hypothetical protein
MKLTNYLTGKAAIVVKKLVIIVGNLYNIYKENVIEHLYTLSMCF